MQVNLNIGDTAFDIADDWLSEGSKLSFLFTSLRCLTHSPKMISLSALPSTLIYSFASLCFLTLTSFFASLSFLTLNTLPSLCYLMLTSSFASLCSLAHDSDLRASSSHRRVCRGGVGHKEAEAVAWKKRRGMTPSLEAVAYRSITLL